MYDPVDALTRSCRNRMKPEIVSTCDTWSRVRPVRIDRATWRSKSMWPPSFELGLRALLATDRMMPWSGVMIHSSRSASPMSRCRTTTPSVE